MPITLNGYTAEGIEELKRENDELKAMVNSLDGGISHFHKSNGDMNRLLEAWIATPRQCLLEHDKRALNDFANEECRGCRTEFERMLSYRVDNYISQLGGNNAK